jgi:hypothetical protein
MTEFEKINNYSTDIMDTYMEEYFTDNDLITQIDNSTFYSKFSNSYVDHNLTLEQTINLLKDLEVGSWILWNYKEQNDNLELKLNAITIKIDEGFVYHDKFIFRMVGDLDDVLEVNIYETLSKYNKDERKIYVKNSYKTMKEYLDKLSKIYGLDLDKQIIYEDD